MVNSRIYRNENIMNKCKSCIVDRMVENINKFLGDLRDCSMAAADYGQKWAPGGKYYHNDKEALRRNHKRE